MQIADDALDPLEPVHAVCSTSELIVTLAEGQTITTPLWRYPRVLQATAEQRRRLELSPYGPDLDEDLSIGEHAGRMDGAGCHGARAGLMLELR